MPRKTRASISTVPCPTTTFEKAFEAVQQLAADFQACESDYLSPVYQEAEARRDFIDKFLIALGWDVNHDHQKNPYQQEVKVERSVNTTGSQRRADYAFHLAPNFQDVRFFVEAKKPFGDIVTPDNCFQAIRYGWSAQTPIVFLTNFCQLVILDSRYMPDIDNTNSRIIKKFNYREYTDPEKFAEIYYLLSREALLSGSFDQYAENLPRRRGKAVQLAFFKGGYQSIDESFLFELDQYRERLARGFKRKNPELDGDTLTEITQRVIDRLVFIRFLEDKMIQPQHLISQFGDKGTAWQDFVAASRKLDGFCNGVVFKKHAIIDSPSFAVDDRDFGDICEKLADINSPYDFNAIPIHILGSIYERFLGKVITTTAKRATVEEKPEVRKAGGVYYTPEYIVRYIVANTVGKIIEGLTPSQIAEMRFADIACGSGSFLLGIFDLLLRYHGEWYNSHPSQAKRDGCDLRDDGSWHLSLGQRRQILLNNIYGVDIDHQAVEVAQLSLYLKLLEEETTATARTYQLEMHETLLPSLNENIVCGNSLIGTDLNDGFLFETDEEKKLLPMDFKHRFPRIFKQGGFDAVIGNPPYVFGRDWKFLGIPAFCKEYFRQHYKASPYQLDMFSLFMERSMSLAKVGGRVGLIVPDVWLTNTYSSITRKFLLNGSQELCFAKPPSNVFHGITVDTVVFTLQKSTQPDAQFSTCIINSRGTLEIDYFPKQDFLDGSRPIAIGGKNILSPLIERLLTNKQKLGDVAEITRGVHPYRADGFGVSAFGEGYQTKRDLEERPYNSKIQKRGYRPFIYGKDLHRFLEPTPKEYIKYGPWLAEPRSPQFFEGERVYSRKILSDRLLVTIETKNTIADQQVYITKSSKLDAHFLAGIMGSCLMAYFIRSYFDECTTAFPQIKISQLRLLPLPEIDLSDESFKSKHNKMISLVRELLKMNKGIVSAKTDSVLNFYSNKAISIEGQIDQLVFDLYELTSEEVKTVTSYRMGDD